MNLNGRNNPCGEKSKREMNKNRYEKAASRGTRLFREKRIENMYSEAVPRKNRLTTVLVVARWQQLLLRASTACACSVGGEFAFAKFPLAVPENFAYSPEAP